MSLVRISIEKVTLVQIDMRWKWAILTDDMGQNASSVNKYKKETLVRMQVGSIRTSVAPRGLFALMTLAKGVIS